MTDFQNKKASRFTNKTLIMSMYKDMSRFSKIAEKIQKNSTNPNIEESKLAYIYF